MPEALDKQLLICGKPENKRKYSYGTCQSSDSRSPTKNRSPASGQKKLLLGMILVSFLSGSLVAVMIPFFPVEAASRGVSQATISAVFSSFAVAQMLSTPVVGRVAPTVGVTRLYNGGIAIAGVTTITFGALYHIGDTQLFVVACFLVRTAEAVGMAAVSACAFTIIANQFPERACRTVALISAVQSIGLSVAPAIGSGLYAAGGFSLPFYVTGSLMVAVAAFNYWHMPSLDCCKGRPVPYFNMLRIFLKSSQNLLCLLTVFHYSLIMLTFDASLAPYADQVLDITPSTVGLYFTVATVAYATTSFLWARVTESSRHPHAFVGLGLLVVSASLLLIPPSPLLGLAPRWWLLGLGMTLMEGSLGGAYIPCLQLMLAAALRQGLPDDLVTQTFVSSALYTAYSMGAVVGPPLGGLVVDSYGFPVMMTCLSGMALLICILNVAYAVFFACRFTKENTSPFSGESSCD